MNKSAAQTRAEKKGLLSNGRVKETEEQRQLGVSAESVVVELKGPSNVSNTEGVLRIDTRWSLTSCQ